MGYGFWSAVDGALDTLWNREPSTTNDEEAITRCVGERLVILASP